MICRIVLSFAGAVDDTENRSEAVKGVLEMKCLMEMLMEAKKKIEYVIRFEV